MSVLLETYSLAVGPRLKSMSIRIGRGEFIGLIGPNGSGKTTFIRAALGLVKASGESSLLRFPLVQRPRHVAYLPQERNMVWPMTVRDLIALGARANPDLRGDGLAEADDLMRRLGLWGLSSRIFTRLSGGEKARVMMARALAQNTPLLLADEPCAALDPAQSLALTRHLRREADEGRAVLASLHDLPLAARWCSRVMVMHQGTLIADGRPDDVLTPELMARVFSIRFDRFQRASKLSWAVAELDQP